MGKKYIYDLWTVFITSVVLVQTSQGVPDLSFTVEPQNTVVVPGSSALLHCAAQSSTSEKPHIKWRTADKQLLTFIGDMHRSQLVNGSLLFSGVYPDQGLDGHYQCVATLDNVGSIVSRTAELRITSLPHFSKQPVDLRVFPGQKAHFSCLLKSSAPTRVTWLKDGRLLRLDETRMIVLPSGSLEIDEVMGSDKGGYRCNVSSMGQHRLSEQAVLTINNDLEEASMIMAPVFIAEPHSAIVSEGGEVTFDCAANGYPNPRITWLKDGTAVDMADLDSRFIKIGTSSLQIMSIQESDEGTYQCRADNREDSVDATASLTVQVPPRFLKKPSDRSSFEKEDVEFECQIYGKPEPLIEWIKNGDVIKQNEYLQVVNGNNLRILGLMELDAGMFQCVGSNPAGNIQAAARLTILSPDSSIPIPTPRSSKIGKILGAFTHSPLETSSPTITAGGEGMETGEVPSPPQGFTSVILAARFVVLSWSKPAAPHGDILTYSVYYRQEGSERERVYNTSGSRLEEANIKDLTPDRTYYFRVLAYNARGPGESSEMLEVRTKAEVHVPGPPIGLKAVATGATSILVHWQPPELSNGPVQRYKMFYMEGDSDEEHHIVTSELSYELTELNKFTDYNIWVVAFNQNGPGANSEEVLVRTWSDLPSEPPQNVTLEASSSSSVYVHWEPPPKEGQNGIITGYKLRYRKRDRKRGDTVTTAGDRRTYPLTGLEKHSVYQVRLWAMTVNGTGPPTDWFTIETYENDLDESQVPGSPSSLKVRPMTDSITVSWSPPQNQKIMVKGYTIGWGKWVPDLYSQLLDGRQRFFVIQGLEPNSEYVISLRAFNNMGDGAPAYETVRTREESAPEPVTPLIPPVGLMAAVLSSSTVVVYWTDTTLPKNQLVSDSRYYQVRYTSSHHSPNPRYKYINSTDLNCMIDDLKPNTQYEFTVKVVKGRRESPWSMVVMNMTDEAPPSTQPRDLTVVPVEDNPTMVNLNWQPPKQPNGPITGYVISYTRDNTQRDRDWVVEGVIGDRMTTTIKGLSPDTTYYFKILARNRKGYGPLSSTVSFTTGPSNGLAFFNRGQPIKDGRGMANMMVMYIVAGCVVVVMCAALVVGSVVFCCRHKSTENTKKGLNKGALKGKPGKTSIKQPPDLWIHHDQMELKALEKTQSSGGGDSGHSSHTPQVNTLPRAHEMEDKFQTNSLDKRTYVSSYIALPTDEKPMSTLRRSIKPKPITIPVDAQPHREPIATATPVPSQGQQSAMVDVSGRPMYPRTQYTISRAHVTLDQAAQSPAENPYSLQGGYDTVVSLPPAGGTPGPPHHLSQSPYSTGMSGSGMSSTDGAGGSGTLGKRLQGHPLKSFTVPAPPPQSAPSTPQQKHIVRAQGSSPYKKAGLMSAGPPQGTPVQMKNRAANPGPSTAEENVKLNPSYSTEELNQEMANLEGLMKDLNAITASEFEC